MAKEITEIIKREERIEMIVKEEALVQVDQNAINVENLGILLEIVAKIKEELNATVAIKKVTLQEIALKEIEKWLWNVINAMRLVTSPGNVKVRNGLNRLNGMICRR